MKKIYILVYITTTTYHTEGFECYEQAKKMLEILKKQNIQNITLKAYIDQLEKSGNSRKAILPF